MRRIFTLGALAAWCTCAQSGVGEWTSAGIAGGSVYRVEYVRNGVALAVTNGGIYRTTNHGATWTLVRATGANVFSTIAVNRVNPDQVLATSSLVLRSVSGGEAFVAVPFANVPQFPPMSAGFSHDGAYAWVIDSSGVVRRSADAGLTWTALNAAVPADTYYWLEPDITDRNTVYAGAGMGILRSRDAGDSWTALVGAASNYAVAPSRTTSGTVLAINTGPFNIVYSTDFGTTWTPSTNGPQSVFRLATGPGARALAVDYNASVHTSTDDGLTWTSRGRLPNGETSWLSIDPANPDRVLGATWAGIVGSNDGGLTWEERNQGLLDAWAFDLAVARDASNAVYVATADLSSIYRRESANGTFTGVARASTPLLGYPAYQRWGREYRIAVAPQDGRTLYMLRDGTYGRSIDGGVTWTRLSTTEPANVLALDPVNPQVAYINGGTSCFKTIDGGFAWTRMPGSLPAGVSQILVDPSNNATVYAAVNTNFGATAPVYKSVDGGANWAPTGWTGARSNFVGPVAIALEPGRSSTIYLAMQQGLYKSTDSAVSWTRLNPVAGFPLAGFYDVVVDPQSPSVVYAASFGGVVRSVNAGETWSDLLPLAAPSGTFAFQRIALVPGHNAKLVALRDYGGVFEMDVAPQLRLTLTPVTLTAGTAGSFTLTVRNDGILAATRVRVTATLPAAAGNYGIGTAGGCSVNVRELSCNIGTLAPAAEVSATFGFTPTTAGNTDFSLSAYETLSPASSTARTLTVQNSSAPPSGGGGGGGGGGGRLDYLLLAFLAVFQGALHLGAAFRSRRLT
ncbi:MAG TPA: hypothetical protein VFU13_08775 [Steroidobacteraceae bacterium]|nr:hypothetical protein [Steroidobacteraceae bacterium]